MEELGTRIRMLGDTDALIGDSEALAELLEGLEGLESLELDLRDLTIDVRHDGDDEGRKRRRRRPPRRTTDRSDGPSN